MHLSECVEELEAHLMNGFVVEREVKRDKRKILSIFLFFFDLLDIILTYLHRMIIRIIKHL